MFKGKSKQVLFSQIGFYLCDLYAALPVEISNILVDTFKGFIESSQDFNMIFSEFFIKILKVLHMRQTYETLHLEITHMI